MIREVTQQHSALVELCRRYRVRRFQLFGSATTGTFASGKSDLDFLAEFTDTRNPDYADRYFDFAKALEDLFKRHVDVLTQRAIRNPYFRAEIERTVELVYEDRSQKTFA